MTYRDDWKNTSREVYWTMPRLAGWLVVFGLVSFLFTILAQPARIVSKTFDANNVITKYEFYHDAFNQVQARSKQIEGHKKIVSATSDPAEQGRLRIELSAMQQSCRDLVGKYNANANKINNGLFRGWSLPEQLDMTSKCE